jgi:hypothetical protein
MRVNFHRMHRLNGAMLGLLGAFFTLSAATCWSQVPTGLLSLHIEQGSGLAWNPEQDLTPHWSLATVSSLRGWGEHEVGANRLVWSGLTHWQQFGDAAVESRKRAAMAAGLERNLNGHVTTGVDGHVFSGTSFERNLRHREEWHPYDATHWEAQWWLALQNGYRSGRLYAEKGAWSYKTLNGFDRREFAFGAVSSFPVWKRVRGKRKLSKVGQQRSHHFANFMVEINHREKQFQTWLLQDGPVVGGQGFRSDAVSAAVQDREGLSLWTETEVAIRLEFCPIKGVEGGLKGSWNRRVDAVRHAYDVDGLNASLWVGGSNRQWSGRFQAEVNRAVNPALTVHTNQGWQAYAHNHAQLHGRLERQLKPGLAVFARGDWQRWTSNASAIGWYQRADWTHWQVRLGLMWQRTNEPRWIQDHATHRRMPLL